METTIRVDQGPLTFKHLILLAIALATGKHEVWRKFVPIDPTGVLTLRSIFVTPDAKHYAYSTRRVLSKLYVIEGLR